jgi:hypothetical protein
MDEQVQIAMYDFGEIYKSSAIAVFYDYSFNKYFFSA